MNIATLNLKTTPRRMLTEREAAEYCALPIKKFSHFCPVAPITFPGVPPRFDQKDLDHWIDSLKTGLPNGDDDIIGRLHK